MDSKWLPSGESRMIYGANQYSNYGDKARHQKDAILDTAILDVAILDF